MSAAGPDGERPRAGKGRLIAVVGPSGVGKDSVIAGIVAADPGIRRVRRSVTRAVAPGGEDHEVLTSADFDAAVRRGAFCLHWAAHGLRYGIPAPVLTEVNGGAVCLVNLSRDALVAAAAVFPALLVLNLTARRETLASRLAARGRETEGQIAQRLARATMALPGELRIVEISNDGALAETVAQALRHIRADA